MSRSATVVHIAGVNVPRRTLAALAAAVMTLGGMLFAYAVPLAITTDARFTTPEDCAIGLLIGLTLAFLGNATVAAFTTPRRKV